LETLDHIQDNRVPRLAFAATGAHIIATARTSFLSLGYHLAETVVAFLAQRSVLRRFERAGQHH
jgi:hypothetical protein